MKREKVPSLFDERHWDLFAEFAKYEMWSGGPDPHVDLTGELAKHCSFEEKLWRGGCYISAYNVASAEVLWQHWPWPRILHEPILPWLLQHWEGITTRTERKGVRIPANMATYFNTYANWMLTVLEGKSWLTQADLTSQERYEQVWDETQTAIKFYGRYVGIKLMEYFRRHCGIDIETPDIRPAGAWSPRTTLTLLYPDREQWLLGNDSIDNLSVVNETAAAAVYKFQTDYDLVDLDMFKFEVLLCNYRQSYVGRKLYPGRTHDTEVRYFDKIAQHWGDRHTEFFNARAAIFPHQHLGEFSGWRKVRNELGYTTKTGFIWSDMLYDYANTLDFAQPAKRLDATMLKATPIIPNKLYQRGVFHEYSLQTKLEFLNRYNVDVVVNLWHTPDEELYPYVEYIHHYFPDSNVSVDTEWLLKTARELAKLIAEGYVVLVHCYAGKNRSGLLNALIYRELYAVPGSIALDHVKSVKSNALQTPLFNEFLASLATP